MTKRALFVVVGFLGCCLSLSAQERQRLQSAPFTLSQPSEHAVANTHVDVLSALNTSYYGFPWLTLSDGRLFSLSGAYNSIEAPPEYLPAVSTEVAPRVGTAITSRQGSGDKTVEAQPRIFDYVHGEVGVLYGTSTGGKFSRELEQGYILGEIGNDKYQINVGAFYEHSSGHFPRGGH